MLLSTPRQTNRILLLLFLLVWRIPSAHAQSQQPGPESDCQGDTVDNLGPKIAAESRAFLSQLKSAISHNEKAKVSQMIKFPLRVNTPRRHLLVANGQEFRDQYSQIITEAIKAKIVDAKSSMCLFANFQGFMVGNGEVWFKEVTPSVFKIVTINVDVDFVPQKPPRNAALSVGTPIKEHS